MGCVFGKTSYHLLYEEPQCKSCGHEKHSVMCQGFRHFPVSKLHLIFKSHNGYTYRAFDDDFIKALRTKGHIYYDVQRHGVYCECR